MTFDSITQATLSGWGCRVSGGDKGSSRWETVGVIPGLWQYLFILSPHPTAGRHLLTCELPPAFVTCHGATVERVQTLLRDRVNT